MYVNLRLSIVFFVQNCLLKQLEAGMLIDFAVENYRSIKNEVILSLLADSGKEHAATNVENTETLPNRQPLSTVRSAVIYGANGAGKTNVLKALEAMRLIVRDSAKGLDEIPVEPFKFNRRYQKKPTSFETTLIGPDRIRYSFGFLATKEAIVEEWLYAWPRGRVQKWYTRDGSKFEFGEKLQGDREVWRRATRPDALFLSTAVSLNSEQLKPVHEWFTRYLRIRTRGHWSRLTTIEYCENQGTESIVRFLHSADLAITDLTVERDESERTSFASTLSELASGKFLERITKGIATVTVSHETDDGVIGNLELEDESDGTQKVFALAGPWIDALRNGYMVVLDELHDNLHPNLVRFLVDCFHNPKLNRNGAQLLFSTHETAMLNHEIFRRDQVWFCERGKNLATSLYALSEFKTRRGTVNLERAYLSGRFGAVPFTDSSHLIERYSND